MMEKFTKSTNEAFVLINQLLLIIILTKIVAKLALLLKNILNVKKAYFEKNFLILNQHVNLYQLLKMDKYFKRLIIKIQPAKNK